ncbi:CAP domain-containing protein [Natronococcus sp.]|uniref:CAP domain-containing protein n=1 Tax=Natronococcus sp. TaxID=35747 RepID=UPI0025F3115A|nr:CAP domain-containing protein [Natronococcus sp.]
MGDPRSASPTAEQGETDRGLLRGLVRFAVVAALLGAIVLAGAAYGPALVDDLEQFDDVDEIEVGNQPSPSSEPPPTGERDPETTDPNDPNESSYETGVETVASDDVEDFVHAEVNDRRAEHDLESIEWDGTVASVSRAHSADMADREYFSHTNPDGDQPYDRFSDVEDYCQGYGENIAMTWVDRPVEQSGGDGTVEHQTAEGLAEGLVNQWMNSTDHREAILEENVPYGWDRGGVGIYVADDGQVFATHNFCHEW